MRHNGRPALLASKLPASKLNVRPGQAHSIVCQDCQTWRLLRRGMVFPHRAADGTTRCQGSAQRITLNIPLVTLETHGWAENAEVNRRRPTRIDPPLPPGTHLP
jgi:hypothetical protein